MLFSIHIDIITIGKERLIFLPKIKIKYELKSNGDIIKKELLGIQRNKTIVFKDDNFSINITVLNNNIIMKRDNKDTCLTIFLGNITKGTYLLKGYNKQVDIDIKLQKKQITDNMIYFKYKSNDNKVEYKLYYEVIPC